MKNNRILRGKMVVACACLLFAGFVSLFICAYVESMSHWSTVPFAILTLFLFIIVFLQVGVISDLTKEIEEDDKPDKPAEEG